MTSGGAPDRARPAVLLTRPRAQSLPLAAELAERGCAPLIWPLLEIAPHGPPPDLAGAQAVLLSSANAARRLPPTPIPALCVGAATASAARAAGARDVRSAEGDADALATLAVATLDPAAGPLLFARGAEVAGDLSGALRRAGFSVREQVVYAASPAAEAPPDIAAALVAGAVAVAAFFSPRSAAAFAALARPWREGLAATRAVAISRAAAAPLAGLGFGEIRIAASPEGEAMRAALLEAAGAST